MDWKQGIFSAVGLMVLLVACPTQLDPSVSTVIGANGGTVSSSNNTTTVVIPAGAITSDTTVKVSAAKNTPAPSGTEKIVSSSAFTIEGGSGDFAKPVEIQEKIDPAAISAINTSVRQLKFPSFFVCKLINGKWTLVKVTLTYDPNTKIVTYNIPGYGTYAIFYYSITSITITPISTTILIGQTKQFTALAKDSNGVTLALQPTFTWSSNNGNVSTGVATGLIAGTSTITVTACGISATVTLTIEVSVISSITVSSPTALFFGAPPATITAVAKDASGNPISPQPTIQWSLEPATGSGTLSASTTSTVSYTPPASGSLSISVLIKATVGNISGTTTITVFAVSQTASVNTISGTIVGWNSPTSTQGKVDFASSPSASTSNFIFGSSNIDAQGHFSTTLSTPPASVLYPITSTSLICPTGIGKINVSNSFKTASAYGQIPRSASNLTSGSVELRTFDSPSLGTPKVGAKSSFIMYSDTDATLTGSCTLTPTASAFLIYNYNIHLQVGWNWAIITVTSININAGTGGTATFSYTSEAPTSDMNWYMFLP
jgi:Bacterial Ig-like domain (group 2)/ZU5 domain